MTKYIIENIEKNPDYKIPYITYKYAPLSAVDKFKEYILTDKDYDNCNIKECTFKNDTDNNPKFTFNKDDIDNLNKYKSNKIDFVTVNTPNSIPKCKYNTGIKNKKGKDIYSGVMIGDAGC
jgi:hypothetical protein